MMTIIWTSVLLFYSQSKPSKSWSKGLWLKIIIKRITINYVIIRFRALFVLSRGVKDALFLEEDTVFLLPPQRALEEFRRLQKINPGVVFASVLKGIAPVTTKTMLLIVVIMLLLVLSAKTDSRLPFLGIQLYLFTLPLARPGSQIVDKTEAYPLIEGIGVDVAVVGVSIPNALKLDFPAEV